MPRINDPAFIYSREQYEAAVDQYDNGGITAPGCLRWKLASRRDPSRYDRVEAAWPTMTLEEKINHLAMLIGSYARGSEKLPAHVITYGYDLLCRRGVLTA